MFVQNKDRWTELRRRCAEKGIKFSQARNSAQGLKLQAKTVADFKNLQNLLVCYKFKFHTYSLKEEREIRVVLRGVPKEIPVDEVKEDLVAQNLPVQSPRPTTRRLKPPSSKSGAYAPSLSGVKAEQPRKRALPGQCHNCQSYGHSSRHCYHSARCVKCLGDHGTAQCTRNKDTDGPPACVLCKQKGHTANYLGCPRAPKRPPPPVKAVPRRAPARAVSATFSYARAAAGPRNTPPAAKNIATSADDLSQLMSIITIIDTSELAILAKKFRSAANPTEKLLRLVEHASLRRDRPRCGVAPSAVHTSGTAARRSVAAYRIVFRVPLLSFRYTTRPARRAVVESRYPTSSKSAVFSISFEISRRTAPPQPRPCNPTPTSRWRSKPHQERANKRPAAARPSEGSTSDSDTSGSDDSDHSDLTDSTEFTTVRRRKASRPKTAKSYLTQAGDGSSYYRITPSSKKPKKANSKSKPSTPVKSTQSIYDAPESWRKTIQPTKATAPTVTLHEADEIVPPAPAKPQRPPPLFIHDKGRWTEIKKQCNTKGIVILNGRNSIKGLKIQPESVTDFRNLSALLATLKVAYHTP
ncbi:Nucleic-acid-binding protein from transposon X-element [Eumeta japonica]|uniref:Nucleic-acid-binding protein from transposon X-element n=1 Tax=Eumeta variegata TaxID=151549 RepID=A0A4C1VC69_EUMVA|nr:Nucleic-acid-binding protein from transposon X-element [Eumeta japonica]